MLKFIRLVIAPAYRNKIIWIHTRLGVCVRKGSVGDANTKESFQQTTAPFLNDDVGATVLNAIYDNDPPPRLFNSAAMNNLTKKTHLKLNR